MKIIENKYGVKIDDVFYSSNRCGRNGQYISFFKVVDLKGKN
ncbi:MAG: hypothetical protein ACK5HP_04625 [Bacilli bacterium]